MKTIEISKEVAELIKQQQADLLTLADAVLETHINCFGCYCYNATTKKCINIDGCPAGRIDCNCPACQVARRVKGE